MSKQAVSHEGKVVIVDTDKGTYQEAKSGSSGAAPSLSDALDFAKDFVTIGATAGTSELLSNKK